MEKQSVRSRYAQADAFSKLRRDIQLTLLQLKGEGIVNDFSFADSVTTQQEKCIHFTVIMNTDQRQELHLYFYLSDFNFLKPKRPFLIEENALKSVITINSTSVRFSDLQDLVKDTVKKRFKGFELEDVVYHFMDTYIKKHPRDVFSAVRRGTKQEDIRGGDIFITLRLLPGVVFVLDFDIKNYGAFQQAIKRGRHHEDLISADTDLIKNHPKEFLRYIKRLAWSKYHNSLQQHS